MSKHVRFEDEPRLSPDSSKTEVATSGWGISWGWVALIVIVMVIVGFLIWKYYFNKKSEE